MDVPTNYLGLVRDILAFVSIGCALLTLYMAKKTFCSDHDRGRREIALDMVKFWTKSLTQKSSIARKLVESLPEEQCRNLNSQIKVKIDSEKKNLLTGYFGEDEFNEEGSFIILNVKQSSNLRWEVVAYLNLLETVFVAWRHNIADRTILEEQFGYLCDSEKGHDALEKFRKAVGSDSFPGINGFLECLKEKAKNTKEGKKKIG